MSVAFGYRKRNPGSGGSRPGAGRRPDFRAPLRQQIGEFCERTYQAEIARYYYGEWLAEVAAAWEARGSDTYWRSAALYNITRAMTLSRSELEVVQSLIFSPDKLFGSNGKVSFEIERMVWTLDRVARDHMEIPIPVPDLRPLPRRLIAATKRHIIYLAKLQIAPSGDVSDISDGIIKACWRYQQQLMKSTEIHRNTHRPN